MHPLFSTDSNVAEVEAYIETLIQAELEKVSEEQKKQVETNSKISEAAMPVIDTLSDMRQNCDAIVSLIKEDKENRRKDFESQEEIFVRMNASLDRSQKGLQDIQESLNETIETGQLILEGQNEDDRLLEELMSEINELEGKYQEAMQEVVVDLKQGYADQQELSEIYDIALQQIAPQSKIGTELPKVNPKAPPIRLRSKKKVPLPPSDGKKPKVKTPLPPPESEKTEYERMIDLLEGPQKEGTWEKISDFLMGDFRKTIGELKKSKQDAKTKGENETLIWAKLTYYSTLLIRMIEVVGEKQHAIRSEDMTEGKRAKIESELDSINQSFNKYLVKYKEASLAKTSFFEKLKKLLSKPYIKPEKLEHQKRYADIGYSMGKYLKKFLYQPQVAANDDLSKFIGDQVSGFVQWANTHPKTAVNMVGDISLTCSIINDQPLIETLLSTFKSRAYAFAFFDALGLSVAEEPIEDEESLKYRAFADLTTYAPWVAATGKALNHAFEVNSVQEWLFKAGKTLISTKVSQDVVEVLPQDHAKFVASVLDIVKGTNVQKILAFQRNIALIKLAGVMQQSLNDPQAIISYIHSEVNIWWRTIWEARGQEQHMRIAVQLALPIGGVLLGAAAIIASVAGVIFTRMNAMKFAFAVSAAAITFSRLLTTWLNGLPVYRDTLKAVRDELVSEIIDRDGGKAIKKQTRIYIADLKKRCALPILPAHIEQSQDILEAAEKLTDRFTKILNAEIQDAMEVEDYVALFNRVIDLKKIKEEKFGEKIAAGKIESKEVDAILFTLADDLMRTWLMEHLNAAFREKCKHLNTTVEAYREEQQQKNPEILMDVDEYIESEVAKTGLKNIPSVKEVREIFDSVIKIAS